jgi:hypothetical protein
MPGVVEGASLVLDPVHSGLMIPAGAERLARRIHRYHLDESGGPFAEHLARVAELVREAGGGAHQVMAASSRRSRKILASCSSRPLAGPLPCVPLQANWRRCGH